jgi:hypothetical protein
MGATTPGGWKGPASACRSCCQGWRRGRHWKHIVANNPSSSSTSWALNCMRAAWCTDLGWISCALALATTWGSLWLAGQTFDGRQPARSVVHSTEMLKSMAPPTEQTHRSETDSVPAGPCITRSSNTPYPSGCDAPLVYVPDAASNRDRERIDRLPMTPRSVELTTPPLLAIPGENCHFVHPSTDASSQPNGPIQRRLRFASPNLPAPIDLP